MSPASANMTVFTNSAPSPSVRMMSGQVRNFNSGRMNAFTSPKISALTITASTLLSTGVMPGTTRKATQMATAFTPQRRINPRI